MTNGDSSCRAAAPPQEVPGPLGILAFSQEATAAPGSAGAGLTIAQSVAPAKRSSPPSNSSDGWRARCSALPDMVDVSKGGGWSGCGAPGCRENGKTWEARRSGIHWGSRHGDRNECLTGDASPKRKARSLETVHWRAADFNLGTLGRGDVCRKSEDAASDRPPCAPPPQRRQEQASISNAAAHLGRPIPRAAPSYRARERPGSWDCPGARWSSASAAPQRGSLLTLRERTCILPAPSTGVCVTSLSLARAQLSWTRVGA